MPTTTRTIEPHGRFTLAQSIDFGFGPHRGRGDASVMRMAFTVDGYREQAAVAVRQERTDGPVTIEIVGGADPDVVTTQVARVLSLDVDATGWDDAVNRDPLLGRLQAARPGLRPPLFHSAYEALTWSVLSARRPARRMAAVRDRLSAQHGATFDVAGQTTYAFPTPEQLLAVDAVENVPPVTVQRLHAIARAAVEGRLDTATLRAGDPGATSVQLRELDGIGPFYAMLTVIRALGHTDVLPVGEELVLQVLGELEGRDGPVPAHEFADRAEAWRPWRTWAAVFIRSAGPRLLPPDSAVGRRSTSR